MNKRPQSPQFSYPKKYEKLMKLIQDFKGQPLEAFEEGDRVRVRRKDLLFKTFPEYKNDEYMNTIFTVVAVKDLMILFEGYKEPVPAWLFEKLKGVDFLMDKAKGDK